MSRRLPSSLSNLGGANGTTASATQSFVIPVVQGANGPEVGAGGGAHLQQQIQSHIAGLIQRLPVADEPDSVDEMDGAPPPNSRNGGNMFGGGKTFLTKQSPGNPTQPKR